MILKLGNWFELAITRGIYVKLGRWEMYYSNTRGFISGWDDSEQS